MIKEEYCEDAISRKSLIDAFRKTEDAEHAMWTLQGIEDEINELPSVTPIRPKGHWEDDCGDLKCPYCETRVSDVMVFSPLTKYTNTCWFCPICGANMREGEESEDNE